MRSISTLQHPIPPTWDRDSEILILGSFPSVKSRECGYYYGHPQNRFWKVLASVFQDDCPGSKDEKRGFLLRHHVAVWDVIASCGIAGSADSSIRDAVPNDIRMILSGAEIRQIICNGSTSFRLYNRLILPVTGREAVCLPSTSPANAGWTQDRLREAWSVIAETGHDPNS
ncbi:MAG: DNA-deoxyinosine glycosylase [Oscillospiraceae bacterium]|nr:DNA-deoxyinosine glycosylase [Oscillospiraceae bacterium]